MKKKNKIPVAIIGKNFGYKVLAKALMKTKRFKLEAIFSKSQSSQKDFPKNLFFSNDWKKLIKNKEIKAIIIATPPHTHEKIINFAIKHEKHIFCEKPCTMSLKQLVRILKKIKNKKKFISHMVNYEMAELDVFKYLKKKIRKNNFKVHSINIQWNILNRSKVSSWKNYHNKGGGLIFNYLCHVFYYLENLFGKVTLLKCLTDFKLNKANNLIEIILKIKNKIFCSIQISSKKTLRKDELFHRLFIISNKGNFHLKSKTLNTTDKFDMEKIFLSNGKLIKKKIFQEEKNSLDFRISPSIQNFKKFADSIERNRIYRPCFLDAKNIHLLIKKTLQSS